MTGDMITRLSEKLSLYSTSSIIPPSIEFTSKFLPASASTLPPSLKVARCLIILPLECKVLRGYVHVGIVRLSRLAVT